MRLSRFLLVCTFLLGGTAAALAHAHLQKAEPPVGAAIKVAPTEVRLWFSQKLEPAFSKVQVLDEHEQSVAREDSKVDPADAAQMSVSLLPLKPGTYKVTWRAVSVDTHVTEGDHVFTVTQQTSAR
ncbi:MAG TPA: copper homeostasis periplasmic binding protein CopC [Alphaproteobacteria bacterium]